MCTDTSGAKICYIILYPPKGVMFRENQEVWLGVQASLFVGLVECVMVLGDFAMVCLVLCSRSLGRLKRCSRCIVLWCQTG
ncbi:hypothetical protein BHM03_00055770 [Ensete ventricosum]|nr:hypothetical protein BHM03_00055770 [Ensete ventricosum]